MSCIEVQAAATDGQWSSTSVTGNKDGRVTGCSSEVLNFKLKVLLEYSIFFSLVILNSKIKACHYLFALSLTAAS